MALWGLLLVGSVLQCCVCWQQYLPACLLLVALLAAGGVHVRQQSSSAHAICMCMIAVEGFWCMFCSHVLHPSSVRRPSCVCVYHSLCVCVIHPVCVKALQWQGDVTVLPSCAVLAASTTVCRRHVGLRRGGCMGTCAVSVDLGWDLAGVCMHAPSQCCCTQLAVVWCSMGTAHPCSWGRRMPVWVVATTNAADPAAASATAAAAAAAAAGSEGGAEPCATGPHPSRQHSPDLQAPSWGPVNPLRRALPSLMQLEPHGLYS